MASIEGSKIEGQSRRARAHPPRAARRAPPRSRRTSPRCRRWPSGLPVDSIGHSATGNPASPYASITRTIAESGVAFHTATTGSIPGSRERDHVGPRDLPRKAASLPRLGGGACARVSSCWAVCGSGRGDRSTCLVGPYSLPRHEDPLRRRGRGHGARDALARGAGAPDSAGARARDHGLRAGPPTFSRSASRA